ncbi:MAG: hypothetical protein RL331_95 [Bacteroidota bacterium]|jgi:hypothetical protein
MKNIFSVLSLATLLLLGASACNKNKDKATGTLEIAFEHVWGMDEAAFNLNTDYVHPMNNEALNFSTFKYYVSNIILTKEDGTQWKDSNSYYLIDLSKPTSLTLALNKVPVGTYKSMTYTLGVDSTRNVSGAQTGALSTANGMFWNWNSGYIMLKAEGTSPASSSGSFAYHLGGFSGANNIVTTKTVNFDTEKLQINDEHACEIHMKASPSYLLCNDAVANGANVMMPGVRAKKLALDFYSSVVFEHLHN